MEWSRLSAFGLGKPVVDLDPTLAPRDHFGLCVAVVRSEGHLFE